MKTSLGHSSKFPVIFLYIISFSIGVGIRFLVTLIDFEQSVEWNGGIYRGQMIDGVPEGEGTFERDGLIYEGTWTKGNEFIGKVTSDKCIYEGEVQNFKFNGYGVCKYNDGRSYWGYWQDDMKHGLGRFQDSSGKMNFGLFQIGIYQEPKGQNFTTGQNVCGIDVSHHQGVVNWQDLYFDAKSDGTIEKHSNSSSGYMQPVLFAFAKSTEGATIRDERFELNRTEAKKCGIIFGAYHFYSMESSAKSQAENFIKNTTLESGDFPPVLDLEKVEYRRKISNEEFRPVVESAKEWLRIVEKEYGVCPIIYTTVKIYQDFIANDKMLSQYDLWIGNPGTEQPNIPHMIMWQFSHNWQVKGIDSSVDSNYFLGDYKTLEAYIENKGIK